MNAQCRVPPRQWESLSNLYKNQTIKVMEKPIPNKPVNWLKIMRIGLLQCVLAALLGSITYARESSAQSILGRDMTLSFNNVSLKEALGQIQEKTEIKFVYSTR